MLRRELWKGITLKGHHRYPGGALALILWLGSAGFAPAAAGQAVVHAPASDMFLDQAYHAMYNLDFDQAFRDAEQAKTSAKEDPLP